MFPSRPQVRPDLLALERLPRLSGPVAISVTNFQGVSPPFLGLKRGYFEAHRDVRPHRQDRVFYLRLAQPMRKR